jgi:hypothetical protein
MRANKGRNLRPRATQSHPPPPPRTSEPPEVEQVEQDLHATEASTAEAEPAAPPPDAPVTMGGDPSYPPAQPVASTPEPVAQAEATPVRVATEHEPPATSPSADLRARETLRELPLRAERGSAIGKNSLSVEPVTAAAPPDLRAGLIPVPSKPVIPAKAVPTPATHKVIAANVAEPKDLKKAPLAVSMGEDPLYRPSAKSEEAKKPAQRANEAKKAMVRAEEAKPAPSRKGDGRTALPPVSRKPAPVREPGMEEDLDPSSISAAFFRKDQDSVPPVEEHEDEVIAAPQIELSPATLARRARLRRVVAGVVAFAGVISIAVVSKVLATKHQPPMPVAVETKRELPVPAEVKPVVDQKVAAADLKAPDRADDKKAEAEVASKKEEAKPSEAKPDEAKKDDAKPSDAKPEEAKKDDAKPSDAKPEEAKKDDAKKDEAKAPSGGDAEALRKETLSLLNKGRNKDAIEKAKEAIAADPTNATAYLYLGSALQDLGKWKDGLEAYNECVRNASKGPINECRAMGGHK